MYSLHYRVAASSKESKIHEAHGRYRAESCLSPRCFLEQDPEVKGRGPIEEEYTAKEVLQTPRDKYHRIYPGTIRAKVELALRRMEYRLGGDRGLVERLESFLPHWEEADN